MAWDNNGLWIGSVTHENGEWLIGDQFPEDHPGHVAKDDSRGLMVKYWTAAEDDCSDKYRGDHGRGGHEPKLPVHGGRREFVQVLHGRFYCYLGPQYGSAGLGRTETGDEPHRDYVDLTPDDFRRWYLSDSTFVRGVTLCRYGELLPFIAKAQQDGYEYRVLDSFVQKNNRDWIDALTPPDWILPVGGHRLIMVFQGALMRRYESDKGEKYPECLSAFAQDYAYSKANTQDEWWPLAGDKIRTVAAVVFY